MKIKQLLRYHNICFFNRARHTLPEGEEDDGLDHEEFEHGAVRAEQLPRGEVKEEQGVQWQADGDVVDDGDVQVTAGNAVAREEDDRVMSPLVICGLF